MHYLLTTRIFIPKMGIKHVQQRVVSNMPISTNMHGDMDGVVCLH
jgi:hypothetical protein